MSARFEAAGRDTCSMQDMVVDRAHLATHPASVSTVLTCTRRGGFSNPVRVDELATTAQDRGLDVRRQRRTSESGRLPKPNRRSGRRRPWTGKGHVLWRVLRGAVNWGHAREALAQRRGRRSEGNSRPINSAELADSLALIQIRAD